jgi:hypothetical protein
MPKTCSRCGLDKPLSAFYKQKGGAQGRRGRCKECYKAAERAAYGRDPEVQAACLRQVKKWRDEGLVE